MYRYEFETRSTDKTAHVRIQRLINGAFNSLTYVTRSNGKTAFIVFAPEYVSLPPGMARIELARVTVKTV